MNDERDVARLVDLAMAKMTDCLGQENFKAADAAIQDLEKDELYLRNKTDYYHLVVAARAYIAEREEKVEDAIRLYKEASSLSSDYPSAYITNQDALASLFIRTGDVERAVAELRVCLPIISRLDSPTWLAVLSKYHELLRIHTAVLESELHNAIKQYISPIRMTDREQSTIPDMAELTRTHLKEADRRFSDFMLRFRSASEPGDRASALRDYIALQFSYALLK